MDNDDATYRKSLEQLVSARTEQLRQAFELNFELLKCLKEVQSMQSLDQVEDAVLATITKFEGKIVAQPPKLGGNVGEPVPEVDPKDVQSVWKMQREIEERNPGQQVATGVSLLKAVCKPDTNVEAVSYRASQLFLLRIIAPEQWAQLTSDGQPTDSVFAAAAKVPMEWMGVGIVRQGPPFNFEEFLRLCGLN
ncbi:MAG: hypothetical protein DMG96_28940 [Acidobacteria bacterium]|nr:MAG: hypothetical protein DMG96_28940 [Acidobacteriota bacterium]